ncbi:UNVERIFIED_CONTAM: hypothetical protein FKN15_038626 [Acipenser sinensis]
MGIPCEELWDSQRNKGSGAPVAISLDLKSHADVASHLIPKGQGGVLDAQASCTQGSTGQESEKQSEAGGTPESIEGDNLLSFLQASIPK